MPDMNGLPIETMTQRDHAAAHGRPPLRSSFYDYTECDGIAPLEAAIRYINENGLKLISVTQNGDQYKVFFQRILEPRYMAQFIIEPKTRCTNADTIRAMDDDELCDFLMGSDTIPCDEKISAMMKANDCNDCQACIMEWLKRPAGVAYRENP